MDESEAAIERWREAGLLDDDQAAAIAAFERDRVATVGNDDRGRRRGVSVEAIGYVGGALAVGAVALLLGDVWDQLVSLGRITILALVTLLLGAAGLALRTATAAPLRRLASALLAIAVGGVAWTAGTMADDLVDVHQRVVVLVASGAALVAAVPLYAVTRRALVQVALLAAAVATALAALSQPTLTPDALWFGLLAWGIGLAWVLLGWGGWLVPAKLAEILGGVLALLSLQVASFDVARSPALVLAVCTAVGLIVLAVLNDRVHHLVVASIGLFVLVPQLVFELFGDAIGAPATLLVIGLLLVLLAVGLGRAHREVREEGRS